MSDDRKPIPLNWYAAADAAATIDQPILPAVGVLDKSELIELSIKPSLWFIPIASARFVGPTAAVAAVIAAMNWNSPSTPSTAAVWLLTWACIFRIVLATLQWATRLYVLTNRRALRFSGFMAVQVSEVPLCRISHAQLKMPPHCRMVGVGTVRLTPNNDRFTAMNWDDVGRPVEVYETVVRAIRRSQHREE